ncbi:MAG: heparinase II/III family protein [Eubacteriales bacterium]|nr:heparinase II/III family protein [Eubacteriales bacterium]
MFFEYEEYIKNSGKYEDMLICMSEEVKSFAKDFQDDPRLLSGWGHGYFCNEDGGRLIYDRKKPLEHQCSICKKVYTDFIYSSYFITMYRNDAVMTACKAALLYRIYGDEEYLGIMKNIISFYADNYKYFAIHAKEKINCSSTVDVGGAGKMMPQGLNEAIVAIRFINAMELVKKELDNEWIEDIRVKFFEPLYILLLPQKMHIHNIPIWLNSAFGIMGLFFGNEQWLNEAVKDKFNIFEQLDNGLTVSGFWYEGSIHYNFFALEGLMTFLVFAESYDYKIPKRYLDKVRHMLSSAYIYAFDNDIFPNPSDGWPNISLKTYSYVYFMGYKVFGEEILPYLNHIQGGGLSRGKLPLSEPYYYKNEIPMEQLLFAADYSDKEYVPLNKRASVNFMDYNCAVLRNDVFNIFLKYGHQTKSHAHPDKMNVEIMVKNQVLTRDISNSGYGTKICNEWNRTIQAHNTCAVNGQPMDVAKPGKIVRFDTNCIEACVAAYEDVNYSRRLEIKDDILEDTFTVEGKACADIDWFFHLENFVDTEKLRLEPADVHIGDTKYFMDMKKIQPEGGAIALENELVKMEILLEDKAEAFIAKTYNNPADKLRDTLIIRKKSSKAVFKSIIKAK